LNELMIPISSRNLKARRLRCLLSQQELSDLSGVNRVTIARLEARQVTTHTSTLRKLATALNCDPRDLVNFDQETAQ
jgi:predicted transcriptional regulator